MYILFVLCAYTKFIFSLDACVVICQVNNKHCHKPYISTIRLISTFLEI